MVRRGWEDVKINEVEALVGVTKKNIRFYEEQGLLSPRRNSENGYREYGETEAETLRRIKLMRKLGVPIPEIRQMLSGSHTVGDGMRRHLVTLERERKNLEQAEELCRSLRDREIRLEDLDAGAILAEMESLEKAGATFLDRQRQDIRIRYVGPALAAAVSVLLMGSLLLLICWSAVAAPEEAPPLPLMAFLTALPAAAILGILLALVQRIREIGKGEAEDAKRY